MHITHATAQLIHTNVVNRGAGADGYRHPGIATEGQGTADRQYCRANAGIIIGSDADVGRP